MLACFYLPVQGQAPEFPPDPGELYVPSVVTIMGKEVDVTDPGDSTLIMEEVDVLGDSTILYNTATNTLTLDNVNIEAGDTLTAAISYTGSEPLVIILKDSSTIIADTAISSMSDVIIRGEGTLVAEAVVPIHGSVYARILFDSVSMYVRAYKSPQALRRRIRGVLKLDESGGPALSGFASADFNKTSVTPPDAEYGEVETSEVSASGEVVTVTINALYLPNPDGTMEVLSEFTLEAVKDDMQWDDEDAVDNVRIKYEFDPMLPMYNILGIQVDATYKGLVIQRGNTYLLQ